MKKKMYFRISLIVIIISIFYWGGYKFKFINSDQLNKDKGSLKLLLPKFKSLPYAVDTMNWEVVLDGKEWENYLYYSFRKDEKDTIKMLSIYLDKQDSSILLESYSKQFIKNSLLHYVKFKVDTFYYYTVETNGNKNFVVGEYNYKFENSIFDDIDEIDYYLLYEDSLGKVRGNGLPNLPTILTKEERRKLELLEKI